MTSSKIRFIFRVGVFTVKFGFIVKFGVSGDIGGLPGVRGVVKSCSIVNRLNVVFVNGEDCGRTCFRGERSEYCGCMVLTVLRAWYVAPGAGVDFVAVIRLLSCSCVMLTGFLAFLILFRGRSVSGSMGGISITILVLLVGGAPSSSSATFRFLVVVTFSTLSRISPCLSHRSDLFSCMLSTKSSQSIAT